ncbi:MAG: class I tRNA ligase family protein, partial [Patescibacteria group bacterium]
YVWHKLADVILESSKPLLAGEDALAKRSRQATLVYLLENVLILLHPFMPFVTEEIWQSLPEKRTDFLMIAPWPTLPNAQR